MFPARSEKQTPASLDAVLIGASVVCLSRFVTYVGLTVIGPVILGSIAAVWWRVGHQRVPMAGGKAALLALGATILGAVCYTAVYDLFWMYFDYRHGAREEEAVALGIAEWLGGSSARQAVEVELSKAQKFSVSQFWFQVTRICLTNAIVAPGIGALTRAALQPRPCEG